MLSAARCRYIELYYCHHLDICNLYTFNSCIDAATGSEKLNIVDLTNDEDDLSSNLDSSVHESVVEHTAKAARRNNMHSDPNAVITDLS